MENRKLTKKEKTDFIVNKVKSELHHLKKDELKNRIKELFDVELKKTTTNHELIEYIKKNCENKKLCI